MSPSCRQIGIYPKAMVYLRIFKENQGRELRITLDEKRPGEETTLQQYQQINICPASLQSLSKEAFSLLHQSAHSPSACGHKGISQGLQAVGQHLYDFIIPCSIKQKLAMTASENLYLIIDDSLVGIPWEILFDGEEFLCLRFNMGRLVITSSQVSPPRNRNITDKIKILVLADPRNDLPSSYQEGVLLSQNWRNGAILLKYPLKLPS